MPEKSCVTSRRSSDQNHGTIFEDTSIDLDEMVCDCCCGPDCTGRCGCHGQREEQLYLDVEGCSRIDARRVMHSAAAQPRSSGARYSTRPDTLSVAGVGMRNAFAGTPLQRLTPANLAQLNSESPEKENRLHHLRRYFKLDHEENVDVEGLKSSRSMSHVGEDSSSADEINQSLFMMECDNTPSEQQARVTRMDRSASCATSINASILLRGVGMNSTLKHHFIRTPLPLLPIPKQLAILAAAVRCECFG